MKVIIGLLVVAVLAAVGTNWARHEGTDLLHRRFDAGLPSKVEGVWTPVAHGHAVGASKLRFAGGQVTTVRCHTTLGSYGVQVDHGFSFSPAATPIRTGCPGRSLRTTLEKATHVDVEEHDDVWELTLSNQDGHTLVTLRSRAH
jgi:hypothetical protein